MELDYLTTVLYLLKYPDLRIPNEGGTVGAVAINCKGEISAATSTGGLTGKLSGRVGDTPIIGGGTFCDDDSCGISATGLGEVIMKVCLCSKIANLIEKGKLYRIRIYMSFIFKNGHSDYSTIKRNLCTLCRDGLQ
jgi:isoaspartyl peptidase/L-asparaginase-like protein (Ntn-hydrolase superfamily)